MFLSVVRSLWLQSQRENKSVLQMQACFMGTKSLNLTIRLPLLPRAAISATPRSSGSGQTVQVVRIDQQQKIR